MLSDKNFEQIPDKFEISFFQEFIDKACDIRTFYLDGKFYSMCIFSQNNELTKVDFRKSGANNLNRTVPYKLPLNEEKKLQKLMNNLNLSTGSIDILKDKNGNYFFLEVNPIGQFGMVSYPCNYQLERKIADYLIN